WVARYRAEGLAGLQDRSSRPQRLYRPIPQEVVERIEKLRRQRLTGKAVAAETGVCAATVSRVLRRLGLNRLSALEPAAPPRRYERDRKSSAVSSSSATVSPVTARAKVTAVGSAGSICIWRSTTARALLTPKSCPTKNAAP